jgi:phosphopantetheine adenylyltransferase
MEGEMYRQYSKNGYFDKVAWLGGDVSKFVPPVVHNALRQKNSKKQNRKSRE